MTNGSNKKIEPRRLKGFRDHMPEQMEVRSQFQAEIRRQAGLAGFREIGTPVLEYAETLLGQGGDETDKEVYRFEDHGGRKVAMRFDLTVPFARFVAEHQGELVFPFKRLQIGDVWRGENTQKGRYREFCQCDLDIIGVDSINADVEVLSCIFNTLRQFDFGGFTMRLGNRVLLSSILRKSIPDLTDEGETEALILLDKLEKIGKESVADLLAKLPNVTKDSALKLLECVQSKDASGHTDRKVVAAFLEGHELGLKELHRMESILSIMSEFADVNAKIRLDLSIARGLGYYTGVVFETTLDSLPGFGSISSGGRYNNLAERFTNRSLPGVGGSIGLDRLLAGLEEMRKSSGKSGKMVFIAVATEDALACAMKTAHTLRQQNISCDIGLTSGKVGNQFKHADRLKCPLVITLGTSEVQSQTFNVKEMATGNEVKGLSISNVVQEIRSRL